jgi:hypothetical protein
VPRPRGQGPVVDVISSLMVKDPDARMPMDEVRATLRRLVPDPSDPVYPDAANAPTYLSPETGQTTPTESGSSQRILAFISHSSSDKERVRELYHKLTRDGVTCWFDEEDLLPGQDWQYEIRKALRSCRYVLACLSEASTSKAGYVQKELGDALDLADEQPEGSIFLIPIRLEECGIPDRLGRLHYVDLFSPNGYGKLLRALRGR